MEETIRLFEAAARQASYHLADETGAERQQAKDAQREMQRIYDSAGPDMRRELRRVHTAGGYLAHLKVSDRDLEADGQLRLVDA